MNAFRLVGLAPEPFAPYFALSDEQLAERGIRRVVADRKPGFPCRISLMAPARPPSIEKIPRPTSSVLTVEENRAAASKAASLRLDGA